MEKKTIYLSGKIAGLDRTEVLNKFWRARDAMKEKGYEVLNPCDIETFERFNWADYIIRDLGYLRYCDAIYMLRDWKDSPGAKVEHAFAEGLGIEIIYEEGTLPAVDEGEYPRANVECLHLKDKWLRMEKPHSMKEFRIKDVRYKQELPEGRAKCYRICLDKCIKNVEVTPSEMRGLMIFGTCETDDGQRFTIVKETPADTQETSPTATPEAVVGAENAQTTSGYLGKVVRVEWQDHYSLRGWWLMKDLDTEPVRCVSIGRVIIETDQILMVAGTISLESEYHEEKASDPIAIVKGDITNITEIQGVAL